MPQTPSVTEFLQKLDNFYEMVEETEVSDEQTDQSPLPNGKVVMNGVSESGRSFQDVDKSICFITLSILGNIL